MLFSFNYFLLLVAALWQTSAAAHIVHTRGAQLWLGHPIEMLDNRLKDYGSGEILQHLDEFQALQEPVSTFSEWPGEVNYWFKIKLSQQLSPDLIVLYQWGRPSKAYYLGNEHLQEIEVEDPSFWAYSSLLKLPQKDGSILIHIKHEIAHLPNALVLQVAEQKSFTQASFSANAFFGAMYGIVLAMIVYNASLCFTLRKATHIIYVIYGFFLMAYIEGLWGYLSEIFHWQQMNSHLAFAAAVGTSAAFVVFLYVFLDLKKYYPRFAAFYLRAIFLVALCTLSLDQFNPTLARQAFSLVLVIVGPLTAILGFMVYSKGYRPALSMSLSGSLPVIGTVIYVLALKGFLTFNFFTENVQLMCFVGEMILISLGMGYQLRLEKDAIISRMDHGYTQLQKLVYPHQVQMIQDGFNLEKTLPVGESHAVVLSLDIIQSSQIEHPDKRIYFQRIFRRCYVEMMKDYDHLHLAASAFRIKEMGDGFLCSVGFPFKTPFDEVPEEAAIQLAFNFLEIVTEELQSFQSEQAVHVSMGIASGQIEGFFAQSGTREYDLFGEAIVLADRYEGLRKVVFKGMSKGHIISVQERVIDALPSSSRQKFKKFQLPKNGSIVIRDDPEASCFYYFMQNDEEKKLVLALNQSA